MKELCSAVEIDAPPERVWHVLTSFAEFPDWNPFLRSATGSPSVGSRLVVRIQPSGTAGMTFRPTVLVAQADRELRWLGRLVMPGLFDGEHLFTLAPLDGGRTLFEQREVFRGLLVPLLARSLDRDILRGFEEMNQALKARAEAG